MHLKQIFRILSNNIAYFNSLTVYTKPIFIMPRIELETDNVLIENRKLIQFMLFQKDQQNVWSFHTKFPKFIFFLQEIFRVWAVFPLIQGISNDFEHANKFIWFPV